MKWNLNLKQAYYTTRVSLSVKKETVLFGIKTLDGNLISLGNVFLNFEELFRKGSIKIKNQHYRINIYLDSANFFIALQRQEAKKVYLEITLPKTVL